MAHKSRRRHNGITKGEGLMLSKKDKAWLKEEIRNAVIEALTVELEWVQAKDEETGMPLAAPKHKTEKTFLPFYWVDHLKFHEGAYRGMQETVDKLTNVHADGLAKIQALGEFLIGMEPTLRQLLESDTEIRPDSEALDNRGG